ncbi:MAG: cellulase family glycosylhydrolase, partial [Treponema sp.]|nr:cellulase family glycosylhydrolase [Treponema sp.]
MKKFLLAAAIIAFSVMACKSPDNPLQDITYTVSQTGGSANAATSTGITFTFNTAIDNFNLTANDITVSGAASKGSATFTGSGTSWTLSPITVNSAGTATVAINKTGIEATPKNVAVYYKENEEQPVQTDITYIVSQIGGSGDTATSTGIAFTFSASIDSLNITANDITVSGAASKGSATFTGSGTSWTLSPITVSAAGTASVAINKTGIETASKNVTVYYKESEEPPTLEYWTITWNLNGGTERGNNQYPAQIIKGTTLTRPSPDPQKAGNTFGGWYSNSGLSATYNFANAVNANLTLYAKWTLDAPSGSFNDISAAELVANIKLGWNLGNTLDSHGLDWLGPNPTVSAIETAWGNPVTTKANIDTLKEAGFNGIRIPVTWTNATDSNLNIRADWIARVKEIANYAASNDMYIILNTHHDEDVIKFRNSEMEASKVALKKLWEQIADAFKDYDEKLIFEGLNEPRTPGSSLEWQGGTDEERNNINTLQQIFVDTVRASGGNNLRRMLMITGYAASIEQAALNAIVLPNDPLNEKNKLILSIHAYVPYNFALNKDIAHKTWSKDNQSDTLGITDPIDRAYNKFTNKGERVPVIIGEFGAMNKDNEAARAEWAKFYVEYAATRGMPCFWWDNGSVSGDGELFGLLNRATNNFTYPQVVGAMTGKTVTVNPNPTRTVTLTKEDGTWRGHYELEEFLDGVKITQGSTYTFTFTFTSNVAIDSLGVLLLDASPPSYWNVLAGSGGWIMDLQSNIPANTARSGTKTFTATATATNATGTANRLLFVTGSGTTSAPTLTFSEFKFEKT